MVGTREHMLMWVSRLRMTDTECILSYIEPSFHFLCLAWTTCRSVATWKGTNAGEEKGGKTLRER